MRAACPYRPGVCERKSGKRVDAPRPWSTMSSAPPLRRLFCIERNCVPNVGLGQGSHFACMSSVRADIT